MMMNNTGFSQLQANSLQNRGDFGSLRKSIYSMNTSVASVGEKKAFIN